MAKQSAKAKELGHLLPGRIRLLSSLIARKPSAYTPEWASAIDDAFRLYTRTSTIDLLVLANKGLIQLGWPFPAYLDLRAQLQKSLRNFSSLGSPNPVAMARFLWSGPDFVLISMCDPEKEHVRADAAMVRLFKHQRVAVFTYLASAPVLSAKKAILADIEKAFSRRMWAACITTAVPLLDCVMRMFFETDRLDISVHVLRKAFIEEAKLKPKDLMPGMAVWEGQRDPAKGNALATSLEDDLRLPGIYLSSFVEFADRYYMWYKFADVRPQAPLNRHAIMHCASEFWTEPNAVKIITFIDLTIRLEKVLKVLIHGEVAAAAVKSASVKQCDGLDGGD